MRRAAGVAGALALATTVSCAPPSAEFTPRHQAAIEDSVAAALEAFAAATSNGEWDAVGDRYLDAPEFIWLEDGEVRYRSPDEVRASLEALTGSVVDARLALSQVNIAALAPGRAAAAFAFDQSFTMSGGGGFAFAGTISAVLVNTDGGWKFLRGHTSTARPPAGGAP